MDSSALHSKLKLLKVVDLRAILAKTDIVLPQKANKADLIAKIQASKPAIDVYHALYPSDDLLAPPEDVDWSTDAPAPSEPAPASKPVQTKPPPSSTTTSVTTTAVPDEDTEAEKRRKRALRFGIPVVDAPKPPPAEAASDKLTARAARFNTAAQKRAAPAENADPEEEERRRKRAERFGITPTDANV